LSFNGDIEQYSNLKNNYAGILKMRNKYSKIINLLVIGIILASAMFGCQTQKAPASISSITYVSTAISPPTGSDNRVIVDMFGRKSTVPSPINRVLCTGPVECTLVYLIAPEKLVGLAAGFNGDPPLVPEKYASLPVIGAWYGAQVGNYETFISYDPDIILEGKLENMPERQQKFGSIPVVGDDTGSDLLLNFEKCITFLGDLLDEQEKAAELNAFYLEAMQYVTRTVEKIPESEKVRVYYAEGLEGLNTEPNGSFHTNLITFCGGINVAEKIPLVPGYGMSEVSLENVLFWDADIIILGRATPEDLKETIMNDSGWRKLKAVQNEKVYLRPDNPFSIFDGPPGPCQILGMYWMIHTLYPEQTRDLDLNAKFKEFYSKFYHYDLTDDEVEYLLSST
jgi:iron complex transport system substrate-binding protein